ncbi:hypothetical protein JG687_00013558 [Phytophthora cactorum]|uniref:Uncharacterized protein n=2 Tax=Phytophthora TaxID=4783 RepID=A0A8J5IKY1_9STRA|nr:hypothetical protein JG688_00014595 [Phytophthora aleatoria]KAG6951514.1 hypothetical protein JG687_00013558 [Phytophthora cactorum]
MREAGPVQGAVCGSRWTSSVHTSRLQQDGDVQRIVWRPWRRQTMHTIWMHQECSVPRLMHDSRRIKSLYASWIWKMLRTRRRQAVLAIRLYQAGSIEWTMQRP